MEPREHLAELRERAAERMRRMPWGPDDPEEQAERLAITRALMPLQFRTSVWQVEDDEMETG